MKHSLAFFKLRWERKKKGFPADARSDFKINSLPLLLCSFSEKQLGSKFHLHKTFVANQVQVLLTTHRR